MRKKLSMILVAVLVLALALVGCGSQGTKAPASSGEAPKVEGPKMMTIGTATVGGAWYSMGGGLANVLNKYIPTTKTNAMQSGASIENLNSIKNGKMEIGFATADIPYRMYRGQGIEENKSFKTLAMNDLIYLALIVKKDSPIKTFEDIRGKKLGTGVAGSSTYVIIEEVLKAHGMSYADVKPFPAGIAQMTEALKDGNIDVFANMVAGTGGAAPGVVDLATTTEIRFIPISDKVMDKLNSEQQYYLKRQIQPGWVKGLTEPVTALAVATAICVKADLPDDFVYNITKIMFDHKAELDSVHPQWTTTTKDTVAKDVPVPLHPGAEKYYKEIGAPITSLK